MSIFIIYLVFKGKAYVDNVIVRWFQVSEEEYPGKFWKSNEQMPSISPFVGQVYLAVSTYHNILTELANEGNLTQVRARFMILFVRIKSNQI